MFKKLLALTLAALTLALPVRAEEDDLVVENVPPEERFVVQTETVHASVQYDPEADLSRYEIALLDAAFPDGAAVTAQDVLFTLYAYLDPGYSGVSAAANVSIQGLESYRRQVSQEHLDAARATLSAIADAGADHVRSDEDPWTEEQQKRYWALRDDYLAACDAQFPACARAIVDYCTRDLAGEDVVAFDCTADEIAASDGLRVAYAMVQWGYATAEGSELTTAWTRRVWRLDLDEPPTLDDFALELKTLYGGDLRACWAVESPEGDPPELPDAESAFLDELLAGVRDEVPSIAGIRLTEDGGLEIDVEGVDLGSVGALLSDPTLSLSAYGDAGQWAPEAGSYGHPWGDTTAVEAAVAGDASHAVALVAPDVDDLAQPETPA